MKRFLISITLILFITGAYAQIYVDSNGKVGVKTTSPETALTVNGEVRILSTETVDYGSAIRATVSNQNACAYHLHNNYYGQDVFYVSGTGFIWCKLGGYFGSDKNMKDDIRDIDSPLHKVLNLHGVTYKFKDPKGNEPDSVRRMGLIAQEVEQVVPEVVKEMNDGTKAIAYTDLIGVLVEAMKEQQAQIDTLQKQVNILAAKTKE